MKKILLAATSAALCLIGAGTAGAVDSVINITATVPTFASVTALGGGGANYPISISSGAVSGTHSATTTLVVNTASNISITSTNGAVTLGNVLQSALAAAPTGTDNHIEYTVAASGSGLTTANLNTTAGAGPATLAATQLAASAVNTTMTILVTPTAGETLVAGSYTDTLTVSVVPQ